MTSYALPVARRMFCDCFPEVLEIEEPHLDRGAIFGSRLLLHGRGGRGGAGQGSVAVDGAWWMVRATREARTLGVVQWREGQGLAARWVADRPLAEDPAARAARPRPPPLAGARPLHRQPWGCRVLD